MRDFRWLILVFTFRLILADPTPGYNCSAVPLQDICDDDCQYCQQEALLDYLWVLNGPNWHSKQGWPANDTIAEYIPLSHCEWAGIYCCGSDNTLLNVEDPALLAYVKGRGDGIERFAIAAPQEVGLGVDGAGCVPFWQGKERALGAGAIGESGQDTAVDGAVRGQMIGFDPHGGGDAVALGRLNRDAEQCGKAGGGFAFCYE